VFGIEGFTFLNQQSLSQLSHKVGKFAVESTFEFPYQLPKCNGEITVPKTFWKVPKGATTLGESLLKLERLRSV